MELLSLIPGNPEKQKGIGDRRACQLFRYLWNKMYPEYRVKIVMNSHDFGAYPDIQISDRLFENALENDFDIETKTLEFADWWNDKVKNGEIPHRAWEVIKVNSNLSERAPFLLEY